MSDAQTLAYDRLLLATFYGVRVNWQRVRPPFPVILYAGGYDTTELMIGPGGNIFEFNWYRGPV